MRFVIVTGPSGAGKTLALHSFEDAGYFASDNLPPRMLQALADACGQEGRERVAVVVDLRVGQAFAALPEVMDHLKANGVPAEILFLDAGDDTLVHRFKETRRPHPFLTDRGDGVLDRGIVEAIQIERAQLQAARSLADTVLDTSGQTPWQLRESLLAAYAQETRPGLLVTITSFGFKHGIPLDADLMFDVRFLSNPHYVETLQPLDGRDSRVAEFVHQDPLTLPFEDKMTDLVRFALPQYAREGKAYLNIAIGCTGGQHRSVVLSEDLAERLRQCNYRVAVRHRDIAQRTLSELSGTGLPRVQSVRK